MIRQYDAQHCRGGPNPLCVGVIATGAIYYFQDEEYLRRPDCEASIRRAPWIIEGLLKDVCFAALFNPEKVGAGSIRP